MNSRAILLGAILASFGLVTPLTAASGVSNATREACAAKADQVRPNLRTPERDQFIANCIADATATKGKK